MSICVIIVFHLSASYLGCRWITWYILLSLTKHLSLHYWWPLIYHGGAKCAQSDAAKNNPIRNKVKGGGVWVGGFMASMPNKVRTYGAQTYNHKRKACNPRSDLTQQLSYSVYLRCLGVPMRTWLLYRRCSVRGLWPWLQARVPINPLPHFPHSPHFPPLPQQPRDISFTDKTETDIWVVV